MRWGQREYPARAGLRVRYADYMKRKVALGLLALLAAYVGYSYLRIRRTLAAADLPPIPLGVELRYGNPGARDPYTVVVLGDSTSQGIGAATPQETYGAVVARRLAGEGRAVRLVNLGVSGANTGNVLRNQLPRQEPLDPDLVLLSVGANDVTGWTPTEQYAGQMRRILDKLVETKAEIAVLDVPAIVSAPLLPLPARLVFDVRTHWYNRELREIVEGRGGVTLVPIYEETREPFERDRTNFSADLYHPSSKGYELWAEVVLAALR